MPKPSKSHWVNVLGPIENEGGVDRWIYYSNLCTASRKYRISELLNKRIRGHLFLDIVTLSCYLSNVLPNLHNPVLVEELIEKAKHESTRTQRGVLIMLGLIGKPGDITQIEKRLGDIDYRCLGIMNIVDQIRQRRKLGLKKRGAAIRG